MTKTPSAVALCLLATLSIGIACAGDSPDVVSRKQEYSRAYQASTTYGVCETYLELKRWQEQNWPEGRATVEAFLRDKIVPMYVADPSSLKGKSVADLEAEYLQMCEQAKSSYQQVVDTLSK